MSDKIKFDENDAVPSQWVKWNVEGKDHIIGTLISAREVEDTNNPGKKQWVYEILASSGEFHDLDEKKKLIEEPIIIKEGEVWNIGGHFTIDRALRNCKMGQIIGIYFVEEKPSKTKGYAPMKIRQVRTRGEMNEEWLAEQEKGSDDDF